MSSEPGAGAPPGVAIQVRGLSKRYEIYDRPHDRLKHSIYPKLQRLLGLPQKQYFREFWALHDVSFDVLKGETVGIVGRNGSGKSTLLQVICGTVAATVGTASANGRIAALLELGSGFNPEFTGRENVQLSCAILGLTPAETAERFGDIADFAGIGDFIEQPVKTYSSGMYLRLAFAVNVMSMPEIMVVDEALAVGDMNFQAKCMTALRRIQENGATVLFVSHDIGAVKSLCSRAVYLEAGRVVAAGKAGEVADRYVRDMREEMNREARDPVLAPAALPEEPARADPIAARETASEFRESAEFEARVARFRYGSGEARITFAELVDESGAPVVSASFDQEVMLRIHFVAHAPKSLAAAYYIQDDRKMLILGAGPRQAGSSLIAAGEGERFVVTYRTRLPLQEGNYSVQLQLTEPVVPDAAARFLDVVDDAIVFKVERREGGRVWAKVLLPNAIRVEPFGRAP